MLISRLLYSPADSGQIHNDPINGPNLGSKIPNWLKRVTETVYVSVVLYFFFLRPSSLNHYTRHWAYLFLCLGSYLAFSYTTTLIFRKWRGMNSNMRRKLENIDKNKMI